MEQNNQNNIQNISNLNSKAKKYFDRIDMLTYDKNKKKSNINNNNKFTLTNEGITFNALILNYLKSFSKFNLEIANSQNIIYNFNNSTKFLYLNFHSILEYSFLKMFGLISKPVFYVTNKKVVIHLFYFLVKNKTDIQNGSCPHWYGSFVISKKYLTNLQ